jgi:hypothetical protein
MVRFARPRADERAQLGSDSRNVETGHLASHRTPPVDLTRQLTIHHPIGVSKQ